MAGQSHMAFRGNNGVSGFMVRDARRRRAGPVWGRFRREKTFILMSLPQAAVSKDGFPHMPLPACHRETMARCEVVIPPAGTAS
jgi:hypothetical protein